MSSSDVEVVAAQSGRHAFSRRQFESEYSIDHETHKKPSLPGFKKFLRQYHPRNFLGLFSIFNLISEYRFKQYFVNDIVSGLTGIF